jgi:hypothetical protein
MADYQLTETDSSVTRTEDGAWIPNDPDNRDWVEYQEWLAEGGVPDPYVQAQTLDSPKYSWGPSIFEAVGGQDYVGT